MLNMTLLKMFSPWIYLVSLLVLYADGHSQHCDESSSTCEIFLDVDHWLPMRAGPNQKVYVNSTDRKLYEYNDDTGTEVDPYKVVLADGSEHERVLALFNKTMPGPTLIVYKNQEVVVHVTNHMLSDGIAVHFHGIEMRGTPWMDGAAFVTQCPIMPGQSFTYRFRPNRSGTYYYHAHLGVHIAMGLVAPFIVKDRHSDHMEEHILLIQDYNNLLAGDQLAVDGLYGRFNRDKAISTLINGRGRFYDDDGEEVTHTPFSEFGVKSGTPYRFRVISGTYAQQYKVSVDGHKLEVVAMDGHNIEPVIADFVILHSGERVDFIIVANQAVDNYWIRVDPLRSSLGAPGCAILRYENAPDVKPASDAVICNETQPCVAVNCPYVSTDSLTCVNMEDLNNVNANDPAPEPELPGKFKEFFLNVGLTDDEEGRRVGYVNGVRFMSQTVSAMTQPREVTGNCDDSHNCGPDKLCSCNRPLDVNFGDVVQITFLNMGQRPFSHPMHIHGYSFHVISVGYEQLNETSGDAINNLAVDCHSADPGQSLCNNDVSWSNPAWTGGNIPDQKLDKAIRKDTVNVPARSYVTIRFRADNPGLWLIHCHREIHGSVRGMGVLLNDSFSRIPPPPEGFPECRNFPPPQWVSEARETTVTTPLSTSTDTTNEAMTSEKRTFSEAEFWGMCGALLFIILVQFVCASLVCLRKNKKRKQPLQFEKQSHF